MEKTLGMRRKSKKVDTDGTGGLPKDGYTVLVTAESNDVALDPTKGLNLKMSKT